MSENQENLRDRIVELAMLVADLEAKIARADSAMPEFAIDTGGTKARALLNIRREAEDELILARAALRGFCYGLRALGDSEGVEL